MFNVSSVGFGCKKGVVVASLTFGAKTCIRMDEIHKLNGMRMKCLWSLCRVARLDRRSNEEVSHSVYAR